MLVIRAHFDGSHIVPDDPLTLPAGAQVVVLVESSALAPETEIDRATRQYYQSQDADSAAEDASWAQTTAPDQRHAWGKRE